MALITWPIHVAWPADVQQYQLWSEAVLVWMLANHAVTSEWAGREALRDLTEENEKRWKRTLAWRTAMAGSIVALLPGLTWTHFLARLTLGAAAAMTTGLLRWGRLRVARSDRWHQYTAEVEAIGTAAFVLTAGIIVGGAGLTVTAPAVLIPLSIGKATALCCIGAAVTFVVGGGTHIVRGVLDKVQALPRPRDSKDARSLPSKEGKVDIVEYNRGRTIGNLERVLMIALIGAGSYEGLGLLVAAKGLIRAAAVSVLWLR